MNKILLTLLMLLISTPALQAEKPVVLSLSDIGDIRSRGIIEGTMGLRPQITTRLVSNYECVVLSRSNIESLTTESKIRKILEVSQKANTPNMLIAADYAIRIQLQRSSRENEVIILLAMQDISEDTDKEIQRLTLRVPINTGSTCEYSGIADAIVEEIAQNLFIKRKVTASSEVKSTRNETWAVLPFASINAKRNPGTAIPFKTKRRDLEFLVLSETQKQVMLRMLPLKGLSPHEIAKEMTRRETAKEKLNALLATHKPANDNLIIHDDISTSVETVLQDEHLVSRIVDRTYIKKVLQELNLQSMSGISDGLGAGIARLIGADKLIMGYVIKEDKGTRLIMNLVDAKTSVIENSKEGYCTKETLLLKTASEATKQLSSGVSPTIPFKAALSWQRRREADFYTRRISSEMTTLTSLLTMMNRSAIASMLMYDNPELLRSSMKRLFQFRTTSFGIKTDDAIYKDKTAQMLDYIISEHGETLGIDAPLLLGAEMLADRWLFNAALQRVQEHVNLHGDSFSGWAKYIEAKSEYYQGNINRAHSLIKTALNDIQKTGWKANMRGWQRAYADHNVTDLALNIAQHDNIRDDELEYSVLKLISFNTSSHRTRMAAFKLLELVKQEEGIKAALDIYNKKLANDSWYRTTHILAADYMVEFGNKKKAIEIYKEHAYNKYARRQLNKITGNSVDADSTAARMIGADLCPFPAIYKIYCYPVKGVNEKIMTRVCKRVGNWLGTDIVIQPPLPVPAGTYDHKLECNNLHSFSRQLLQNLDVPDDAVFMFFFTGENLLPPLLGGSRRSHGVMNPQASNPAIVSHYYFKSEKVLTSIILDYLTQPISMKTFTVDWMGWPIIHPWRPCVESSKRENGTCSHFYYCKIDKGLCSACAEGYTKQAFDRCHQSLQHFLKSNWKFKQLAQLLGSYRGKNTTKGFGWRNNPEYPGDLTQELDPRPYKKRMASFINKAEKGDAYTQGILGRWFETGDRGLLRDYQEALKWARLSAEQNHPFGLYALAHLYREGKGVVGNEQKAEELFKACLPGMQKLAEKDAEAQCNMGQIYLDGHSVVMDLKKAKKWFRAAADQKNPRGLYNLGIIYQHGKGVGQDEQKALEFYLQASQHGYAPAQVEAGRIYQYSKVVSSNYEKAYQCYKKAADQGYPRGLNRLGVLYLKGCGHIRVNGPEAEKYFRQAAWLGEGYAVRNLGILHNRGISDK